MHPNNSLVDEGMDVKLCNFQGSMGGYDGKALETIRYCLPRPEFEPSVLSDIFALGSTIFRIMTGEDPYKDLLDSDVQQDMSGSSSLRPKSLLESKCSSVGDRNIPA